MCTLCAWLRDCTAYQQDNLSTIVRYPIHTVINILSNKNAKSVILQYKSLKLVYFHLVYRTILDKIAVIGTT